MGSEALLPSCSSLRRGITPSWEISVLPLKAIRVRLVGRSWREPPTLPPRFCRMGQSIDRRATAYARRPATPRPASSLSDFYQLDAKILHVLQSTMKLSLVPKGPYQDRAALRLFYMQVKSLECSNEGISQLSADADLIGEALGASGHDGVVAAWPLLARAQIAMDMSPLHTSTRAPMIG
jgi:hypothetical protein